MLSGAGIVLVCPCVYVCVRMCVCLSVQKKLKKQVAQLSQRDRAAAWVSCGANINVVFRIQRTLL